MLREGRGHGPDRGSQLPQLDEAGAAEHGLAASAAQVTEILLLFIFIFPASFHCVRASLLVIIMNTRPSAPGIKGDPHLSPYQYIFLDFEKTSKLRPTSFGPLNSLQLC